MTGWLPGRWRARLALAALVLALVAVLTRLADVDVDWVALLVLAAVVVAAVGLALDTIDEPDAGWPPVTTAQARPPGADPVTAMYTRLLEDHLTARADDALPRELAGLVMRRLALRGDDPRLTDPGLDDPRWEGVLGPDLLALLRDPRRRLTRAGVVRIVERIEQL